MSIIKTSSGGGNVMTDLSPVYKKYKGEWVALKEDNLSVISHGKDLVAVKETATKKGYTGAVYFKVPTKLIAYVSLT